MKNKTINMTYEEFIEKYEDLIARYAFDFIDDDPENEDEAHQMAVDAVVDNLACEGVIINFTSDVHASTYES